MDSRFADSLGFFFCTIRFDSESIFAGAYVMLSTYSAVHTISWSKEKASSFLPSSAVGTGAGNALERVQRVHEPADLQGITFWTRRILTEPADFFAWFYYCFNQSPPKEVIWRMLWVKNNSITWWFWISLRRKQKN